MRIVDEEHDTTGVLQVDWRLHPTEFLYVLGDRPTPQPMPLDSSNKAVQSAKFLSIDYLLDVAQVLTGDICYKTETATSAALKPIFTKEPENFGDMTTEDSEITTLSDKEPVTTEETTPRTTRETAASKAYIISTTCVSVSPDGTSTNSSFQVNIVTDQSYTQKLVDSIYSQLVIPRPLLSSYRRRLRSAPDRRTSSCVLGVFACASISTIVGIVFLLDLTSWRRHWLLLKRNLCNP